MIELKNLIIKKKKTKNDENLLSTEIVEKLKKEYKNLDNDNPSSRKEIILLKNWFYSSSKEILENIYIEPKEKFYILDELLQISFNETIKQISYVCYDMGDFIKIIWKIYFNLIKNNNQGSGFNEIENFKNERNKIFGKISDRYDQELNRLREEISLKEKNINDLKKEMNIINAFNQNMKENEKFYIEKIGNQQFLMKKLKYGYQRLQNENKKIFTKLERKMNNNDKNNEIITGNGLTEEEIYKEKEEEDYDEDSELNEKDILNCFYEEMRNTNKVSGTVAHQKENIDSELSYKEFSCQTELNLIDKKYDVFFSRNDVLNDILQEYNLKNELIELDLKENNVNQNFSIDNLRRKSKSKKKHILNLFKAPILKNSGKTSSLRLIKKFSQTFNDPLFSSTFQKKDSAKEDSEKKSLYRKIQSSSDLSKFKNKQFEFNSNKIPKTEEIVDITKEKKKFQQSKTLNIGNNNFGNYEKTEFFLNKGEKIRESFKIDGPEFENDKNRAMINKILLNESLKKSSDEFNESDSIALTKRNSSLNSKSNYEENDKILENFNSKLIVKEIINDLLSKFFDANIFEEELMLSLNYKKNK